jgi:hypothetical protein
MARRIEAPEAKAGKYPWAVWFDGTWWELTRGQDFDCEVRSMQSTVSAVARARGLACETKVRSTTRLAIKVGEAA